MEHAMALPSNSTTASARLMARTMLSNSALRSLEGGHVHDDAVNPQQLAVVAHYGAAALDTQRSRPSRSPRPKLHEVRSVLLDGRGDFRPRAVHLFGQRELGEVDAAFQKVLRQPARECGHASLMNSMVQSAS